MSFADACQDLSCDYCLGLSPNSRNPPIRIPVTNPQQQFVPLLLRDGDSRPGIVHIPTPNITDFTPFHYSRTAKPSNEMFEHTNPVRLGTRVPPGFMPKPPPRKDVKIVPNHIPPRDNIRELNRYLWERTQMLEDEKKKKRARDIMPQKTNSEMHGKKEAEKGWSESRGDSGVEVAISFV